MHILNIKLIALIGFLLIISNSICAGSSPPVPIFNPEHKVDVIFVFDSSVRIALCKELWVVAASMLEASKKLIV